MNLPGLVVSGTHFGVLIKFQMLLYKLKTKATPASHEVHHDHTLVIGRLTLLNVDYYVV
jgi:hypothetical protein